MPKKAYKKKYKAKRKKFAPKLRTTSMILRGPYVVPDEMLVKMRYNISATHAGTGIIATDLSGNNPGKVFAGGSGGFNSAMGMNEWQNFYNQFQVIGSRCNVDFLVDFDPSLKKAVKVSLAPYNGTGSPPTTIVQNSELTYAKTKLLAENQNETKKLNTYMSTKKILGYHNDIDDVSITHGNFGAISGSVTAPVLEWSWSIMSDSLSVTPYELQIDGYVDYYVRLFRRRTLKSSSS